MVMHTAQACFPMEGNAVIGWKCYVFVMVMLGLGQVASACGCRDMIMLVV